MAILLWRSVSKIVRSNECLLLFQFVFHCFITVSTKEKKWPVYELRYNKNQCFSMSLLAETFKIFEVTL